MIDHAVILAAVVDTYPKWADVSRTVIAVTLALYLAAIGYALYRNGVKAKELIAESIKRGKHEISR